MGGDDGEPLDISLGEGFGEEVFAAKYGQVDILPGLIEGGRLGVHSVEQEDGAVVGLFGAGSEAEWAAGQRSGVAGVAVCWESRGWQTRPTGFQIALYISRRRGLVLTVSLPDRHYSHHKAGLALFDQANSKELFSCLINYLPIQTSPPT